MKESYRSIGFVKGLIDPIGTNRPRERHESTCQSLRQAHDVRHNARKFTSEHRAGPAEAGEDFIGNERNVELGRKITNAPQILDWMNDHATGGLNQRFDDDCRDILSMLSENRSHAVETFDVAGFALQSDGTMKTVGGVSAKDRKAHRSEGGGEGRIRADRHGA